MSFRKSKFWNKLIDRAATIKKFKIKELFGLDSCRVKNFSFKLQELNMYIDFSKQHIDLETLNILCNAAEHCELSSRIKELFNGTRVNVTENKSAWHTRLRDPRLNNIQEISQQLLHLGQFENKVYSGKYNNILCLGIGGSYLGPIMVAQALDKYTCRLAKSLKFYFIANHDRDTKNILLNKLDPNKTILIINSKSFTTTETILNAQQCIDWLNKKHSDLICDNAETYKQQVFAVTSNIEEAIRFGIMRDNIFFVPDYIGGRYSIWSNVGLSIMIKLGSDNFKKFLQGAHLIDYHFQNTRFINNIPIIMALISIWNINFMEYTSLAIIPYLDALEHFPSYLQQLAMESNGKNVDLINNQIDYNTAEIIWGGVGSNVQHSFMQMLHQGSQIVPVDFLFSANNSDFLAANCIAQSQALMEGNEAEEQFKKCLGNRPSTTILFSDLTPEVLGALIAIYEHKTFVQGVLWNINSFDQWGVELGKKFAKDLLDQLNTNKEKLTNTSTDGLNLSTNGLMEQYKQMNIFLES